MGDKEQEMIDWVSGANSGPAQYPVINPDDLKPCIIPDGFMFPQVGTSYGPRCVCMNCLNLDPKPTDTKIMLDGVQQGCVVFAVEGDKGIVIQRMIKQPDNTFGPNYRVQVGKVEFQLHVPILDPEVPNEQP